MRDLSTVRPDDLRQAIEIVPVSERDRLVLRLRLLERLTYQKIADYPGVHVGTRQVGNILSMGCSKIGDYLDLKKKRKIRDFLRHFLRIS